MNGIAKFLAVVCVPALFGPTHSIARDLAPLSASELQEACRRFIQDVESSDGGMCPAYIRGFIEGSPLVILRHQSTDESFAGRALRTRYGGANRRPLFCLRDSVTVNVLANQIVSHAESHPPTAIHLAGDLIEATLTKLYRCSVDRRNTETIRN